MRKRTHCESGIARAIRVVTRPVGPRESVGAFAGPALVIPVLKAVRGRRGIKTAIAEYPRFCAGAEAGFQSLRAAEGRDRDVVADHQGGENAGATAHGAATGALDRLCCRRTTV
jgi:hypothetical protein